MKPYEGNASTYIRQVIIPSLPKVEDIIAFTESLYAYLLDSERVRYIRKFKSYNSRGRLYNHEAYSFTVTDNEPAIWIYMECFEPLIRDFLFYEERKLFPVAFAIRKNEKPDFDSQFNYGKKSREIAFSNKGLKHCHILDCSPRDTSIEMLSVDQRMLRLMSPMNHFPFPAPRRNEMPKDFGEDVTMLSMVKKILYEEYYKTVEQKGSFIRYLKAAGDQVLISEEDQELQIVFGPKDPNKKVKKRKEKIKKPIEEKKVVRSSATTAKPFLGEAKLKSNFKISESDYGQGKIFSVRFKKGPYSNSIYRYNHDEVYDAVIPHLKTLNCWEKYAYYVSSRNIPKWAAGFVEEV